MQKLNVTALANTFAVIDLVLHTLFRVWVLISPESYVNTMHLFVEGLQLRIDPSFDLNFTNFIIGSSLEATAFWVLGATVAVLYNKFTKTKPFG